MYIVTTIRGHQIKVKELSIWIGNTCRHEPTCENINILIELAKENGMCAYDNGRVNAHSGTPLYSNGERRVKKLADITGRTLWSWKVNL